MIQDKLRNKNVLFFLARTFNLEKNIKLKLESLGCNVTYYDERLASNTLTKGIIRLRKSLYKNSINSYYLNILKKTMGKRFDYLLVIRGEVVPEFFLREFRKQQPRCTFIFYNWDSFTNTPHTSHLLHLYDRTFSFDPEDAKKYNMNF